MVFESLGVAEISDGVITIGRKEGRRLCLGTLEHTHISVHVYVFIQETFVSQ